MATNRALEVELARPEVRELLHELTMRQVIGDIYFEKLPDNGWRVLRDKTALAEGSDMIVALNNALKVRETLVVEER